MNAASFVSDVTIPDGTVMRPEQSFTKTWRIRNSGSTKWSGYSLAFVSDAQMGAPAIVSVPTTAPGTTVDISVPMTAPTEAGFYRSDWQMRTADGKFFGTSVYVLIMVKAETTPSAKQRGLMRPILYLDADGRELVISGVYPDGDPLGTLVRSSERGCICDGTGAIWAPDGSVFAYFAMLDPAVTGNSALYIQNLQGEVKTIFTTQKEQPMRLTWSPDGQRIAAILSNRNPGGGSSAVYSVVVINLAGQKVESRYEVPSNVLNFTTPQPNKFRWSPNGRKILLSWGNAVVVHTETGILEKVADKHVLAEWGPNSDAIYYFDSAKEGLGDFYLKKLGSASPIKLTDKAQREAFGLMVALSVDDWHMTLSPSGSKLAIVGGSIIRDDKGVVKETIGIISVYDLQKGGMIALDKPFKSFRTKDLILALEWAPDEKSLAAVGSVREGIGIKVLDVNTGAWRTLSIIPSGERGGTVGDYYAFGFKTISWTQ